MIRNIQIGQPMVDKTIKPTPRLPGTPMGATGIPTLPEPVNGNSKPVALLTPDQKRLQEAMMKAKYNGF